MAHGKTCTIYSAQDATQKDQLLKNDIFFPWNIEVRLRPGFAWQQKRIFFIQASGVGGYFRSVTHMHNDFFAEMASFSDVVKL